MKKIISSSKLSNSFWGILEMTLYPFLLLFSIPLFIDKLGSYQYGIWILVNTIIATFGVMNLGLGDATIKFVASYRGASNPIKIKETVESSFTIALLLAFVFTLLGLLVGQVVFFFELGEDSYRSILSLSIPIASATFGLKFIEQIILATFRGLEKYHISACMASIGKIWVLGINIILVYLGYGLITIFITSLILTFCFLVLEMLYLRSFFKGISYWPQFKKDSIREIFSYGKWAWAQSLIIISSSQVDKFIVTYFAGLEVLTYYSIGYMVYFQLHTVFSSSANWVFPWISAQKEKGNHTKNIFFLMRMIVYLGCLAVVCFLFLTSDWIFRLWLGEEVFKQSIVFIKFFLCYESLIVLSIIPYYYLNGSGFVKLNTYLEGMMKSLNMICMVLFFSFFGTEGLVYGLIFSLIIFLPYQDYKIRLHVFQEYRPFKNLIIVFPSLLIFAVLESSSLSMAVVCVLAFLIFTKYGFWDDVSFKNTFLFE